MKKVLVIRLGAFGDMVMCSPVFRLLKEQGYYVAANVSVMGVQVVRNNPYIDEIIVNNNPKMTPKELDDYWMDIGKGFDRIINLSGSIEESLLKPDDNPDSGYFWSKARRHEECNVNYYDRTLELSGFSARGLNGELYFSHKEHREVRKVRKRYKDKFLILWSLSGSSYHKAFPYAGIVAQNFLDKYSDAVIITVGDAVASLLEWQHTQTICKSDKWSLRKSMLMTKYSDLVVGTETGILNAAGCYDTPKIVMLSHSSHENLSKYWNNCYPVHADVPCYPCHQLHYQLESCPLSEMFIPLCIDELKPEQIMKPMEEIYKKWRVENGKSIFVNNSSFSVAV